MNASRSVDYQHDSFLDVKNLKRAVICGIGGQDGAYLAAHLLEKGYKVTGTSRDGARCDRSGLVKLGIVDKVDIISMATNDFRSVMVGLQKVMPDEIYNLAGQTSVGLSFDQPVETIESIAIGVLNLLEAIRCLGMTAKFYNAGSSECFGDTGQGRADEQTPFRPQSPYAVAKVCAHHLVNNYRQAYGIQACTGILFNHESPLRPRRFVTQKIVMGARDIHLGRSDHIVLGNLEIERDWGWAPDYVDAMWRMLQQEVLADYVIATGRTVPLKYFVEKAFQYFDLDWTKFVRVDENLMRPSDIGRGAGNPSKAERELGWTPKHDVDKVVSFMCESALAEKY
jgi:GDPmannose 4,6-dehydratase